MGVATRISGALGALVGLALGFKLLLQAFKTQSFDGLSNVVSFSSKLIAAARALEAEERHALVEDALAAEMAGPAALASARQRAAAAPAGTERTYQINKMAIRTRWFDDQINAALGMPVLATIPAVLRSASAAPCGDLSSYVWTQPEGHQPRQLVMLGAGMDSRPWRMKLPADLRWFELDQGEVLEAKKRVLQDLAAEVPESPETAAAAAAAAEELPLGSPKLVESGLASHTSLDQVRFPLRCDSWAGVACDLSDPSWADALLAAGFDPQQPTVWVAEGLLMYLEEESVRGLLRKMAEISQEGSVFVGLTMTESVIERVRARATRRGNAGSTLMDTWVFGCPTDPTEFLADCGWRLQLSTTRAGQAVALGLNPELCGFPLNIAEIGGSLFLVATPVSSPSETAAES